MVERIQSRIIKEKLITKAVITGLNNLVNHGKFERFDRFFKMLFNLFVQFSNSFSEFRMKMIFDMIVGSEFNKNFYLPLNYLEINDHLLPILSWSLKSFSSSSKVNSFEIIELSRWFVYLKLIKYWVTFLCIVFHFFPED